MVVMKVRANCAKCNLFWFNFSTSKLMYYLTCCACYIIGSMKIKLRNKIRLGLECNGILHICAHRNMHRNTPPSLHRKLHGMLFILTALLLMALSADRQCGCSCQMSESLCSVANQVRFTVRILFARKRGCSDSLEMR